MCVCVCVCVCVYYVEKDTYIPIIIQHLYMPYTIFSPNMGQSTNWIATSTKFSGFALMDPRQSITSWKRGWYL